MLVIRLGGVQRIDLTTIKLDAIDLNGTILLANISTDRLDSVGVRNATIRPPTEPFIIRLTGKINARIHFFLTKWKEWQYWSSMYDIYLSWFFNMFWCLTVLGLYYFFSFFFRFFLCVYCNLVYSLSNLKPFIYLFTYLSIYSF